MKRSDIMVCPFFRLTETICKKDFYIDCFCICDPMIIFTHRVNKKGPSKSDKKHIRRKMREMCAYECPKIWEYLNDDDSFDDQHFLSVKKEENNHQNFPEFDNLDDFLIGEVKNNESV